MSKPLENYTMRELRLEVENLRSRIETQGQNLSHYTTLQLNIENELKVAVETLEEIGKGGYNGASFIAREALKKIKEIK